MLPISSLLGRLPQTTPLNVVSSLSGARVFHLAAEGQALWVADLPRLGGAIPLENNLFLSADGTNFHQLRIVDRKESLVLTDTPGLLPALAVYRAKDMTLAFGEIDSPSEGLSFLLNRVSAGKLLERASFFPFVAPAGLARSGEGPRVRVAEAYREPDRKILSVQSRIAALDRGREHLKEYRADRGLEEASRTSAVTPFGPIEVKIESRLSARPAYRSEPLSLLTIGPGKGRMEAELNKRFDARLSIDAFALNDTVAPENWYALENLFVGNLDTHRLPIGYDFIISIFGSSYAVDQRRALGQIVDSLKVGGEAFFIVTGEMIAGHAADVLGFEETKFLRERYGLIYEAHPNPRVAMATGLLMEYVYLKKTKSCPSSEIMFAPTWDVESLSQDVWEVFEIVAKSRDVRVDPSATVLDVDRFRERLAWQRRHMMRSGHDTSVETILFAWPWILDQGILVRR